MSACNGCSADDLNFRYSFFMLLISALLQFHWLEHLLFFNYPMLAFVSLSLLMAHFCLSEFSYLNGYIVRCLPALMTVVAIPFVSSFSYTLIFSFSIVMGFQDKMSDFIRDLGSASYEMFPTMDYIVITSSMIAWAVSAIVLFNGAGAILLHDAILSLAVFNCSRIARSMFASKQHRCNDSGKVRIARGHQNLEVAISNLKKGDVIIIDDKEEGVVMPVAVSIEKDARYMSGAEKVELADNDIDHVDAGTKVYSGSPTVKRDYVPDDFRHQDTDNNIVKSFLMSMYMFSFVFSSFVGYTLGPAQGFAHLSQCLMLVCPCVYTTIKYSLLDKNDKNQHSHGFDIRNLPIINGLFRQKITVVIDRTFTLSHPRGGDQSGDYVMDHEVAEMVKALNKDSGYDVFVLSGHHDEENSQKVEERRKEMARALGLSDDRVIFDKKYHGEHSEKGKFVEDIRRNRLGRRLGREPNIWDKLSGYICPRVVVMVGNDINDQDAFDKADLSIGVGAYQNSISPDIKIKNHKDLKGLYEFLNNQKKSSFYASVLIAISMMFTVLAMASIIGLTFLGFSISTGLICTINSAYCTITAISSYIMREEHKDKSISCCDQPRVSPPMSGRGTCNEQQCSTCRRKDFGLPFRKVDDKYCSLAPNGYC